MAINLTKLKGAVAKAQAGTFRLEDYLFKEQLTFVQDSSPFKIAVTTRRAGKTTACALDLLHTALNHPDTSCLYITLTRVEAKRLVWREMKRANAKFNLGVEFNESDLCAVMPNGSMIYCTGASDRSQIEKQRGKAFLKVYIDECQSFPAYIEDLIDDVIGPALLDYAGSLILIGTPGAIPTGYFYKCYQSIEWSHHFWTFFDNHKYPSLKTHTHQQLLDRELKRRGVTVDHPSIKREWFGKWEVDTDSLVYHYDKSINGYESLPDFAPWNYILGVDLGFNDADALSVLAWSAKSPATYLVHEEVTRKQTISGLVAQIEKIRATYEISKIVVDTGGLGKKIAEELSRRYAIPVQAAEKVRKVEYIELMNDALRSGRLKAKGNTQFASDCMKVEWDLDKSTPDRKVISKRFHSDICESVLYAWRESYSYTYSAEPIKPVAGTAAWYDAEAEKIWEDAEQKALEQAEIEKLYGFSNG